LLQIQCEVAKKDHRAVGSDRLQNAYCKTDVGHDLKVNGLKKNGYCASFHENGMVSNGHVKNGHCLLVNGNGNVTKNGYSKDGHWEMACNSVTKTESGDNGYCGVIRRQNHIYAGEGKDSLTGESDGRDEQSQNELTHVPESNHIKVSCSFLTELSKEIFLS